MTSITESRWIGPVGILLLIAVGLFVWAYRPATPGPSPFGESPQQGSAEPMSYASDAYGIAFEYPATYALTETDPGNGERKIHFIMLTPKADLPPPANGEGPPAIEIALYQNDLDRLSALDWMRNDSRSNFKLGDGTYATTTVDGADAVFYRWSGLYEGATLAFPHKGNMVAASVTYLNPSDRIVTDYQALLSSLALR